MMIEQRCIAASLNPFNAVAGGPITIIARQPTAQRQLATLASLQTRPRLHSI